MTPVSRQASQAARAARQEQWVVTLARTPLAILRFGQGSLVGLLANALAIPWVTLVVTPLAMAGVFVHALWGVASYAVQAFSAYLEWLASWPAAKLGATATAQWEVIAGEGGRLVEA